MSSSVLTLVAAVPTGLSPADIAHAVDALRSAGAQVDGRSSLSAGQAEDVRFTALAPAAAAEAVRAALAGRAIDVFAQATAARRKKLLLADMDSTIVIGETLDELAAHAGLKDKIAAITARAMNGELDFEAALKERVGMLAGLPIAALEQTYAQIEMMPGALTLVRTMAGHGARCVLVSGGFKFFTSRIAARCGFHADFANDFILDGTQLSGRVVEPILDRSVKLQTLQREAAGLGVDLAESCTVGDGANDLPMLQAAGLGVAFHGKPTVAAAAPHRVDHCDLTALLYAQGYAANDHIPG
jgi:phosphoserine phosphatase